MRHNTHTSVTHQTLAPPYTIQGMDTGILFRKFALHPSVTGQWSLDSVVGHHHGGDWGGGGGGVSSVLSLCVDSASTFT